MKDVLKVAKDKHKCPPHHFIINSENVGRCKYCPEVRDYNSLQGREGLLTGLKSKRGGKKGKRGRKPATITAMSTSAKERWQDPEYRAKQRAAHHKNREETEI